MRGAMGNCRLKTLSVGLESLCLGQTNQFTKVDATPRPATSDVAAIELRFGREFDRRLTDSRVDKFSTWLVLLLLTGAAVLLHGYHPYVEDAEIYLPGIERILNPQLFPTGQKFFQSHASMSLFSNLVAYSMRATHLSLESGLFLWHVASIFLLLLAGREKTVHVHEKPAQTGFRFETAALYVHVSFYRRNRSHLASDS